MKKVSLVEKVLLISVMAISGGATAAYLSLTLGYAVILGLVFGVIGAVILGILVWARS